MARSAPSTKAPRRTPPRRTPPSRKPTLADRLLAALGAAAPGALPASKLDRLRLAGGRPLPAVARAMLARRAPAWGIPGMWKPGATGSLRGVGIVALVTRFVGAKDFQPGQYWDLEALARALPGRCHVLDVDLPVRFLYVGEPDEHDDYPVLTLQQADDALEVVVEAPSLAAYYALRLGLIAPPTYVGGLYQVPAFAREMKAALARCGVTPARDRSRLHVAAPHRPPIEPPAPAEPSTRTTRTARTAPGHEVRLPDWVSELYPPFAATLREVSLITKAEGEPGRSGRDG